MSEERQHLTEGWHLDRRVPIAIIGAIVAQGAMIIWWAAGVDARLGAAAYRIDVVERLMDRAVSSDRVVVERMTRLETQQLMMIEQLREVRSLVARRADGPREPPAP